MAFTFFNSPNWFQSAADPTVTASWAAGDEIFVFGASESSTTTLATPTATGLTFAAVTSSAGASEATAYLWRATAASAGASVVITAARGGANGGQQSGLAAWVHGGAVSAVTALAGTNTEAAYSQAVTAGDAVIVGLSDFNATNPPGKTPLTGSGTATEQIDTGNTTNYAVWAADWVGVAAGTFSFGPNNYTSLQVAQVGAVVTPTAAPTPSVTQSHYRFGLDDGTESTHTFAAAEDTGITAATGLRRLLRVQLDETAGADSTAAYRLQYKRTDEADTEWRDI